MFPTRQTITDLHAHRAAVVRGRYGCIETRAGRFVSLTLLPWPKLLSWPEIWPVGERYHAMGPAGRCRLYYNQPRHLPQFLALKYMVTTAETDFATFRAALAVLDQVAEIKRTHAIVCDAANGRLSDRLMRRLGWEAHKPERWHRNYIRRFHRSWG